MYFEIYSTTGFNLQKLSTNWYHTKKPIVEYALKYYHNTSGYGLHNMISMFWVKFILYVYIKLKCFVIFDSTTLLMSII